MSPHQCKHFNGLQHDLCKRGVRYEQFRPGIPCIKFVEKSSSGGTYLAPGEEPAELKPWKYEGKPCQLYEAPTTDEVQDDRRKTEAMFQQTIAALRAEVVLLRAVAAAAVRSVRNPAWAGVCDEDVELERVLRVAGLLTPNVE